MFTPQLFHTWQITCQILFASQQGILYTWHPSWGRVKTVVPAIKVSYATCTDQNRGNPRSRITAHDVFFWHFSFVLAFNTPRVLNTALGMFVFVFRVVFASDLSIASDQEREQQAVQASWLTHCGTVTLSLKCFATPPSGTLHPPQFSVMYYNSLIILSYHTCYYNDGIPQ